MENVTSLEEIKSSVYLKAGKNMHLFQAIESILKLLTANGKFEGPIVQLKEIIAKQNASTKKQTMGQLVSCLDKAFSTPNDSNPPDNSNGSWMSFSFNIASQSENANTIIERLSIVVSERNHLAHHFFSDIKHDAIDSWSNAERYLDAQREKVMPQFEYFKSLADAYKDSCEVLIRFLESKEGLDLFGLDEKP